MHKIALLVHGKLLLFILALNNGTVFRYSTVFFTILIIMYYSDLEHLLRLSASRTSRHFILIIV